MEGGSKIKQKFPISIWEFLKPRGASQIFKKVWIMNYPQTPSSKIKITRLGLGLQCRTPLKSYSLSLILYYPLSLIPYPVSLRLGPDPLVLFLSRNLDDRHEKSFFVRKPIFGVEKCPQIQINPKHIKVPKIAFFSMISDISEQKCINCG